MPSHEAQNRGIQAVDLPLDVEDSINAIHRLERDRRDLRGGLAHAGIAPDDGGGEQDRRSIHSKAKPVIVAPEDYETWLFAALDEALAVQRPWPDNRLRIVNVGPTSDPPE